MLVADPFVVLAADNEQLPYNFQDVPGDTVFPAVTVRTNRVHLPTGDYTLPGCQGRVSVERKSKSDFFTTACDGRDRFERELARLDALTHAAVVVEAEWSEMLLEPARHGLDPKALIRSVMSWCERFPRVAFWSMPGRRAAEVLTLRLLQRWWSEIPEGELSTEISDGKKTRKGRRPMGRY